MKKFFVFLSLFFLGNVFLCLLFPIQTIAAVQDVETPRSIWRFFADNWSQLGLIMSEILALFSKKYSGILKTLWELLKPSQ